MSGRDLHTHTIFSDGTCTPEEMALAAAARGLDTFGFSDHSYTAFDESWCMKKSDIPRYLERVRKLKEAYRGRLEILCGVEQDFYSDEPTEPYDYVIGSVHYLKVGDAYLPVDESAALLQDAAERYFGGDIYALAELYFETVSRVVEKTHADIIGHFDLISKFNEQTPLFDPQNPRYVAAWQAAADKLIASGKPFEINTGAIFRGYKTVAYPAPEMLDYIAAHGGRFVLSSDSHQSGALCFAFERYAAYILPKKR